MDADWAATTGEKPVSGNCLPRNHLCTDRYNASERASATIEAAMAEHFHRQRSWSLKTFGPGQRTAGVIDHIRKELREIEAEPLSIEEWIDVAILAFDGAWRAGAAPEQIAAVWLGKQAKNEARNWPDWRTVPTDKAIEHVRDADAR